jgi:signal transduction histidine kinase
MAASVGNNALSEDSLERALRGGWARDIAVSLLLVVLAVGDVFTTTDWPQPRPVSAVFAATAAAFLVLRRRRPEIAFAGSLGTLAVAAVTLGHFETGSSLLIAVVAAYGVGAHGRRVLIALAVTTGFAVAMGIGQPPAEALADTVVVGAVTLVTMGVGLTVRRLRHRATDAEGQVKALEAERSALAEAAAAEERHRIARELHDVISHSLSVIVLQAGAAEQALTYDAARARDAVSRIRTTGLQAISEMATLVGLTDEGTSPPRVPQPTLADVDRLVTSARSAGVTVSLKTAGEERELPASVELNAFRVIQEGITNAMKHAHGARVLVAVTYLHDAVEVRVTNDGTTAGSGPGGRRGLIGLQERVSVFAGRLEAGESATGGWTLCATFPTPP